MFCKDCGSKLDEESKICKNCNPDPVSSDKGNRMWKIIALSSLTLFLVVGLGIVGSFFLSGSDSEDDFADESIELVSTDLDKDDDLKSATEAKLENERLRLENEKLRQEMDNKDIMHENELLKERIDSMNKKVSNQSSYNPGTSYYGNSYRITWDDLDNLSKWDIDILRNEIYARNGYIFTEQPFVDYFESQSWYYPNSGFHEGLFNSTEKANINTIVEYETYHGWR